MTKTLDFYRNIPRKECTKCGHEVQEQFDCYITECECHKGE